MSKTLRNMSLAFALMVSATPLMMSAPAYALSSHDCSVAFKAAKAAGTDGGATYKDFRAANCAAGAAAPAAPAAAAPAAPAAAAPAAAKAAPVAKAAAAPAVPATASGSFMKDCSDAWKASKANGTRPAGLTWKDFVAAKCVFPGAAAAPVAPAATKAMAPAGKTTPVVVAPTEPTTAADGTPLATADKNGKPFTPGQMAAHKRIRECGNQWRDLKAANKVPVGTKWPQFWSACNKQLKAAGQ